MLDFKFKHNEPHPDDLETFILNGVLIFFSSKRKYVDMMLDIINGDSDISIRVLDWFVSNYSNRNHSSYIISINGIREKFEVNVRYRLELRTYTKKYFDPFCRRRKLIYYYKDKNGKNNVNFETSIGQLNFFKWAIKNKVILYVSKYLKEIELDMKKCSKENKERKKMIDNIVEESNYIIEDNIDPLISLSDDIYSISLTPEEKITTQKIKRKHISSYSRDISISNSVSPESIDFN